jgi:hypothetical protein
MFKLKYNKNNIFYNGLIITFILLYSLTAFVSWYHSITFFNIANAIWLSVLLSFVAEIGQASVLFAILLTKNKNKLLPWIIMIILTTLQIIGNVVSSYKYIVISNNLDFEYFKTSILFWVQTENSEMFKIIIAWISGGILPIIALSMTALVAQNLQLKEEQNLIKEPELIQSESVISDNNLETTNEIINENNVIEPELIQNESVMSDNLETVDEGNYVEPDKIEQTSLDTPETVIEDKSNITKNTYDGEIKDDVEILDVKAIEKN